VRGVVAVAWKWRATAVEVVTMMEMGGAVSIKKMKRVKL